MYENILSQNYFTRSGYPKHLRYKLLQRHAKCLCDLGKHVAGLILEYS